MSLLGARLDLGHALDERRPAPALDERSPDVDQERSAQRRPVDQERSAQRSPDVDRERSALDRRGPPEGRRLLANTEAARLLTSGSGVGA